MKTFSPQNNTSEEGVSELFPSDPDLKNAGAGFLARLQKGGGFTPTSCRETLVFAIEGELGYVCQRSKSLGRVKGYTEKTISS